MRRTSIATLIIVGSLSVACVPQKQLVDTKAKYEKEIELLKEKNQTLTVENNEIDGKFTAAYRKLMELEKERDAMKNNHDNLSYQVEKERKAKEDLEKQIKLLKDGSSDEITKLMEELQKLQLSLQEREDRVRKSEDQLQAQEDKLKATEDALKNQQAKLIELQDALNKQKDAVTALKDKLAGALRGFYDQGLSVHEKNGKVYVSLEEQLLFQSGSYSVDPKGQQALRSLGEVLANNPEINIMVEGHTDNVPLNGAGQVKDNWDLSVMRATSVTKIILGNKKIDPKRITSAGRGEYIPLDPANTPAARTKNRRTEIILTPNLSEVLQLLQSN